jgi:hypothetical protein
VESAQRWNVPAGKSFARHFLKPILCGFNGLSVIVFTDLSPIVVYLLKAFEGYCVSNYRLSFLKTPALSNSTAANIFYQINKNAMIKLWFCSPTFGIKQPTKRVVGNDIGAT